MGSSLKVLQRGIYRSDNHISGNRLGQPSRRTGRLSACLQCLICVSAHEQAGDVETSPDFEGGVNAVPPAQQTNIHDDEIRLLIPRKLDRISSAHDNAEHLVSSFPQGRLQIRGDKPLIFHYQETSSPTFVSA